MAREVFLEELPRYYKGVNWGNSIGKIVRFEYDDISGMIEILDFIKNKQELVVKYDDKKYYIKTSSFIRCRLGRILGVYTKYFKITVGEVFKNNYGEIAIIDKKYKTNPNGKKYKYYKYKCNKCGYEGWIEESNLLKRKQGCSCCCGRTTVLGINTIWDTDRWMCDLGVSEEDAKRHTKCSNTTIEVTCPHCGAKKKKSIHCIYYYKSIGCNCGDGFSYPEKFMYSVLKQLGVEFKTQLSKTTFEWCNNYKYDFYIPSINTIIEVNGEQHYKDTKRKGSRVRTLSQEQENDKLKQKLALLNAINNYIVIDCRRSNMEFIQQNILNSKLSELINLSNVNYLKADEYATTSNKIKDVCNYWNNKQEFETTTDLVEIFNVHRRTIIRYLKQGAKHGWCTYNPKEENIKMAFKNNKSRRKNIEVFKDGLSLGVFNSCYEIEKLSESLFGVKFNHGSIYGVCSEKLKHYKGYVFKYTK